MAIGDYTFNNPISAITGFTTIEGGFDPSQNWRKTSQAGATKIIRTSSNPEGPAGQQRLVAIYMNNASHFRFQDLTIEVADATANGMSIYGIHLTSCSDYDIVRCKIETGNAGGGNAGVAGSAGIAGQPGLGGQAGSNDDQDDEGSGGTGGAGGGAGAGSAGAGGFLTGCCSTGAAGGKHGTSMENIMDAATPA